MIGRLSFHTWFVSLLIDLLRNTHKYFRDSSNKKKEFFLKCDPMIKNLNVILLSPFWLTLFRKKERWYFYFGYWQILTNNRIRWNSLFFDRWTFWISIHDFHHQQHQWQLQKLLLIPQTLSISRKNHYLHLEKVYSLSGIFGERLIRKISNFQSRSILIRRSKVVRDSKFPDASL